MEIVTDKVNDILQMYFCVFECMCMLAGTHVHTLRDQKTRLGALPLPSSAMCLLRQGLSESWD